MLKSLHRFNWEFIIDIEARYVKVSVLGYGFMYERSDEDDYDNYGDYCF